MLTLLPKRSSLAELFAFAWLLAAMQTVAEMTYLKGLGLPFAGWMSDEDCGVPMLNATNTSIGVCGLVLNCSNCLQVWELLTPVASLGCRLLRGQPSTGSHAMGPDHASNNWARQCQLHRGVPVPFPSPAQPACTTTKP